MSGAGSGHDDNLAVGRVRKGFEGSRQLIQGDLAGHHRGGIYRPVAEGRKRFRVLGWAVAEDELQGELLVDPHHRMDAVFLHADTHHDNAATAVDELHRLRKGPFDTDSFEDDGDACARCCPERLAVSFAYVAICGVDHEVGAELRGELAARWGEVADGHVS